MERKGKKTKSGKTSYVKVNGIFIKVHGKLPKETSDMIKGDAYYFKESKEIYIYYGTVYNDEITKAGLYISDEDENDVVLLEYSEVDEKPITRNDVIQKDINTNFANNIFDRAKSIEDKNRKEEESNHKNDEEKKSKRRRKPDNQKRLDRNDVIHIPIEEDDDVMVSIIKEKINESGITMDEVYNKKGNQKGYNMYYGLLGRHTISIKSVEDWCDVLNCTFDIILRSK
jgi:hypothetical protein